MKSALSNLGRPQVLGQLALLAGITGSLFWAFWPTLGYLIGRWSREPQYSHGYLVPVFALWLLWLRRKELRARPVGFSAWGLPLLGAAAALRLAGTYFFFLWLEASSLLVYLAGVCVLLGGWGALRWAWPAIAFLLFMIPLPYQVQLALGGPLQQVATAASTYLLQTMGLPAVAEGNVIVLDELRIGVVEACNGLSMLLTFFAIATAVALLVRRPVWEKGVVVASAVPVALIANVARITTTAVLYETVGSQVAGAVFHEWGGWLMMPLALSLLGAELWVLAHLFLPRENGFRPVIG